MLDEPIPRPGWYILLEGEKADLDEWLDSLTAPHDPVALILHGDTVLRSLEFDREADTSGVYQRALILIGRLNGIFRLANRADVVRVGGVIRVDDEGKKHITKLFEFKIRGRSRVKAFGAACGPDGLPLPLPPPAPSQQQKWSKAAEDNVTVEDLLIYYGKADNWYDIYKTIEVAEKLAGGEHKLLKLVQSKKEVKNLKASANYYRHAHAHPPKKLTILADAAPILTAIIRTVL